MSPSDGKRVLPVIAAIAGMIASGDRGFSPAKAVLETLARYY
jgi:hypothetical protein